MGTSSEQIATCSYLREKEIADMLHVAVRTVRTWRKRGYIPYRKIGRTVLYVLSDIQSALDRFKIG